MNTQKTSAANKSLEEMVSLVSVIYTMMLSDNNQ